MRGEAWPESLEAGGVVRAACRVTGVGTDGVGRYRPRRVQMLPA